MATVSPTAHAPGSDDQRAVLFDVDGTLLEDRKSTRLNSSHSSISYAVLCLKKKNWVMFEKELPKGAEEKIEVFYEGVPVVSRNPPWVGGITWGRDDLGEPFIVTTCQGIGESIWWPNKDNGSDEPDRGMQISVTVPEQLVVVSNGRLKKTDHNAFFF